MSDLDNSYCQIIEKTINLPALQQYYHVDVFPERVPLVVLVDQFISSCSTLKKFGMSINVIGRSDLKALSGASYLELVQMDVSPVNAEIVFTYKAEGIKGVLNLINDNKKWVVKEYKIVEM